jgi:hypothetical protein
MTTKHRPRGEAGRIGWIKAGLILGGLMASVIGSQMLTSQAAPASRTADTSTDNAQQIVIIPQGSVGSSGPAFGTTQVVPSTQFRFSPITRSRSS